MASPKPPSGLGTKAKGLWAEVTGSYELRADEIRILEDACREMDLVDRLETELAASDLVVVGSTGQPRVNPLSAEIVQHRGLLLRLLQGLKLPEGDSEADAAARSAQMRDIANKRWNRGA